MKLEKKGTKGGERAQLHEREENVERKPKAPQKQKLCDVYSLRITGYICQRTHIR